MHEPLTHIPWVQNPPLGFRTAEFAWSRYAQWLAGARGIELAERRLVPPLGHFSLVRFRKVDVAAAA